MMAASCKLFLAANKSLVSKVQNGEVSYGTAETRQLSHNFAYIFAYDWVVSNILDIFSFSVLRVKSQWLFSKKEQ